jgi:V-type H+-transporting ATPase subunit H
LKGQVDRKSLKWGPVHREEFWKENVHKFHRSEENLQIIVDLVDIVKNPKINDTTKAIACFDLGEFARYSGGKRLLD